MSAVKANTLPMSATKDASPPPATPPPPQRRTEAAEAPTTPTAAVPIPTRGTSRKNSDDSLDACVTPTAAMPIPARTNSRKTPEEALDNCVMDEFLTKQSPVLTERFSLSDIVRNPNLAKAARREMDGQPAGPASSSTAGSTNGVSDIDCHDAEIERQRSALGLLDQEVQDESKVNKEMAQLVIDRLQSSVKTLEELLKLIGGWSSAENAYSAALSAAASVNLVSQGDSEGMRTAGRGLTQMLTLVGQAHSQLQASLASSTQDLRALVATFKAALKDLTTNNKAVQHGVEDSRKQLQAALEAHAAACTQLDAVVLERCRGRTARPVEQDPWATEGVLVQMQRRLKTHQDRQRGFLKDAFRRAQELEQQRVEVMGAAMTSCVSCYTASLLPIHQDLSSVEEAVGAVRLEEELRRLEEVAKTSGGTSAELAERQGEALEGVQQELFCSPEIVRQGPMQRWNPYSSEWVQYHFVLTRSGFLHWFRSTEEARPVDTMGLARCEFSAGEAPVFGVLERQQGAVWFGGKTRKETFKANTVEDCCEWAIAVRESIASALGR